MKIQIDKNTFDYVELKEDFHNNIDLSIRVKKDSGSSIIVTAKLDPETLDKLIAQLLIFKAKVAGNHDKK